MEQSAPLAQLRVTVLPQRRWRWKQWQRQGACLCQEEGEHHAQAGLDVLQCKVLS
jgi:hypothetical protein